VRALSVKGVIVAGGEGKRFRPLTYYIQKCMIPVGDHEKPILEYIIRLLHHHHVDEHILLTGYKHQQILNYFGEGERFDVKIRYILDPPDFKGSASALLNAWREGAFTEKDTLLIYYGDIVSNVNLGEMLRQHKESGAAATLALAKTFSVSVGVADVDKKGMITSFVEKPDLEKPVTIGILIFDGSVLKVMQSLVEGGGLKSFDIMGDVVSYLVKKGYKVGAYLTDADWYDIGSIERYEKLDGEKMSEAFGYLFT
jgi:mannose-1-phosphate guanylyltransferase